MVNEVEYKWISILWTFLETKHIGELLPEARSIINLTNEGTRFILLTYETFLRIKFQISLLQSEIQAAGLSRSALIDKLHVVCCTTCSCCYGCYGDCSTLPGGRQIYVGTIHICFKGIPIVVTGHIAWRFEALSPCPSIGTKHKVLTVTTCARTTIIGTDQYPVLPVITTSGMVDEAEVSGLTIFQLHDGLREHSPEACITSCATNNDILLVASIVTATASGFVDENLLYLSLCKRLIPDSNVIEGKSAIVITPVPSLVTTYTNVAQVGTIVEETSNILSVST